MHSKLSAIAARFVESSWLAALVVVPVFFNVQSVRVFEADKLLLLRSIAVLMCVGLVVRGFEEGPRAWTVSGQPLWRAPLVKPTLLLTCAYLVSTAFSVAPRISLLGSYDRVQGTYTWLSYVTIFVAIILLIRERAQSERIVTTILLTSLPVAAYAVVQHFDYDPIAWRSDIVLRSYGSAGNAIFLSAFLIMVVPLTLVRIIEQLTRPRTGRLGRALLGVAYALLLGVQLLAIVYSQSRGPFVGLAAGLTFFFLVFAVQRRLRRVILAGIALTLCAALVIVVLNIRQGPLQSWRDVGYLARLATVFEADTGTGKVRALVWQGATALLASHPLRDLIGYGPDALFFVYPQFHPAELAHFESREIALDRCHNETFDALTMTGGFGGAAEIILYGSLFFVLLRGLGMIGSREDRHVLLGATAAGGVLGTALPYLVDGSFRFSGVGLPMGMIAGVAVYLLAHVFRHADTAPRPVPRSSLLSVGLLAAVIAHAVEIQLGIAVSMTRLLFWVYAGLAVCVGLQSDDGPPWGTAESTEQHSGRSMEPVCLGLTVALILFALTVDFCAGGVDPRATGFLLLALFPATWLLAAVVAAAASNAAGLGHSGWTHLRDYAVASFVPWLLLTIVYVSWLMWSPSDGDFTPDAVIASTAHIASAVAVFYLSVLGLIALTTVAALQRDRPLPGRFTCAPDWRLGAYAGLGLGALAVILITNLQPSRADVFDKRIAAYKEQGHFEAARAVAEEAVRLQPETDRYAVDLSAALMDLARRVPRDQPQQRDALLARAVVTLQNAQRNQPLNPDHPRNLAQLHRAQAEVVEDPSERARHLEQAQQYYNEATQLNPHNANLWNEWAQLCVERWQLDKAFAILDHSLRLDDRYASTYWLRGNLHVAALRFEDALADYERATAVDPAFLDAWRAKATVLKGLNRLQEAIAADGRVLAQRPRDLQSRRDLALLYQQTGQFDRALHEAQRALRVADGSDRAPLEQLIERLKEQRATQWSADGSP